MTPPTPAIESAVPVEEADDAPKPSTVTSRWRRVVRRWWIAPVAVVVVVFGYYLFNLYDVLRTANQDQARRVDAIVVLGAAQYDGRPSSVLAARLDHTVALWRSSYAPRVVVTGGKQPGDRFTEASVSARYLVARGVPGAAILLEDAGRTSWESMQAAAAIVKGAGGSTVLLVSDPYHILRLKAMASELGLRGYGSPTRTSPVRGWSAFKHELKEAAGVGVARFVGYGKLVRFDHR